MKQNNRKNKTKHKHIKSRGNRSRVGKAKSRPRTGSRAKGKKAKPKVAGKSLKAPRTVREYFARTRQFQETWDSVAHVISRMRTRRVSLPRASREFGLDPEVVKTLGRPALRKQKNGKFVAKRSDKLFRLLTAVTEGGPRQIPTRDSNLASVIGKHSDAVQWYLQTGNDGTLKKFKNNRAKDLSGKTHFLITDTAALNRLASAGVLSFESLYSGRA